jgi:hypothetical protein
MIQGGQGLFEGFMDVRNAGLDFTYSNIAFYPVRGNEGPSDPEKYIPELFRVIQGNII